MRNYSIVVLAFFFHFISYAQTYNQGWEALNKRDNEQAKTAFAKVTGTDQTALDSYLSDCILRSSTMREATLENFLDRGYKTAADPNPYLYALWFEDYFLGDQGRRTDPKQLKLLQEMLKDTRINGSIKASAHYNLGVHYFFSNEYPQARKEKALMGSIANWQFVGPFDNLSESGFDKNYGPIENPSGDAVFTSSKGTDIKWFTPAIADDDGWVSTGDNVSSSSSIIYAQTFVQSPKDQTVVIAIGGSGSIKIWVNDQLVISEAEQRVTELDAYRTKVNLKSGYNRILVQLGNTNSDYPNFIVRFTDEGGNPIEGLSNSPEPKPYSKVTGQALPSQITHFAEEFFLNKTKTEPDNLLNYILLNRTYIRNNKYRESVELMEPLAKKYPQNEVIQVEYLSSVLKGDNRTLMLETIDKLRKLNPKSYLAYELKIQELVNEEKIEQASKMLDEEIVLFGSGESQFSTKITILNAQKNYEEMFKTIEKAYNAYPFNVSYNKMMASIYKEALKDKAGAERVLEKFLKTEFNYQIILTLKDLYTDGGKQEKALKLVQKVSDNLPTDCNIKRTLAGMYFKMSNYKEAEREVKETLDLEPYNSTNLENMALIKVQQNDRDAALKYYRMAVKVNPNLFQSRDIIRQLEEKSTFRSHFKYDEEDELYAFVEQKKLKDSKDKSAFICDWRDVVVYPEGSYTEIYTYAIQVFNNEGIKKWKEITVPYDEARQDLNIEKAEIIKAGGARLQGESNGNQLVFTKLEVGDVVLLRYKISSYVNGRIGRKYYSSNTFGGGYDAISSRYCVMMPTTLKMNYKMSNGSIEPVVTKIEDGLDMYSWEIENQPKLKDEYLMPEGDEILPTLYVSTIKDWNEVADWYSDLSRLRTDTDVEFNKAYASLALDKPGLTEMDKAKIIYQYIQSHIKYSSVPFRQSRFVPQKPGKTITTQLGDCKDMSELFVAFAEKCGLDARMVLVLTRDNGTNQLLLPSVSFNHCIVKINTKKGPIYQELTNEFLPFGAISRGDNGALALEIPRSGASTDAKLIRLPSNGLVKNEVTRKMVLELDGDNIQTSVKTMKRGDTAADFIDDYKGLSAEDREKSLKESVSSDYTTQISNFKLDSIAFVDHADSVNYNYQYVVTDAVTQVGD